MTSESITTNTDAVIEMVYIEPDPSVLLSPAQTPGKLFGYYNGILDAVQLFIVDSSGLRLLRI